MLCLRLPVSLLLVCGCVLVASAQNRPEVQASPYSKPPATVPQNSLTSGAQHAGAAPVQPATLPAAPRATAGQPRSAAAGTPRQLLPLRPPRVSYSNGMLSIVAENSTLADVLNAVRQKTGAAIEAPPSAATERVIISIGPAPANAVLITLLNGSRFDYILLGAHYPAGRPERLILREKQGTTQANAANPGGPGANSSPQPGISVVPVSQLPPEMSGQEEEVPEAEVPDEAQPEPQPEHAPGQQQQQQQQGQPQVKTPEQLLEELKQMQQQQQMQQQLQQQQQQQQSQPQQNELTPQQQQPIQPPQQPPDNEPPPDR